jgi:hypothetical protein
MVQVLGISSFFGVSISAEALSSRLNILSSLGLLAGKLTLLHIV